MKCYSSDIALAKLDEEKRLSCIKAWEDNEKSKAVNKWVFLPMIFQTISWLVLLRILRVRLHIFDFVVSHFERSDNQARTDNLPLSRWHFALDFCPFPVMKWNQLNPKLKGWENPTQLFCYSCLEQLIAKAFRSTIKYVKIMGKFEFNCQTLLSEMKWTMQRSFLSPTLCCCLINIDVIETWLYSSHRSSTPHMLLLLLALA